MTSPTNKNDCKLILIHDNIPQRLSTDLVNMVILAASMDEYFRKRQKIRAKNLKGSYKKCYGKD